MLEVGSKVPEFTIIDNEGNKVSFSKYFGRKLVVYFYPKDHTPGCTRQACSFRDNYSEFKRKNIEVIGISKDDHSSHSKFKSDYGLPFTLLSDPSLEIANLFGVVVEKNMYGNITKGMSRTTFVIDENGVVIKVFPNADPDNNAKDILEFIG